MNPLELAASHNRWSTLPVAEKLLLFGGLLAAALLVPPPVGHAVIVAVCGVCGLVLARVPARVYLPALLAPAVFLLVGVGPLVLDLVGGRLVVDPAGVTTAWQTVSRALAATAATITLACTTPVAHLLAAGRRVGLPAPLAHVVDTTYRLVGILLGTMRTLGQAHDLRLGHRTARTAVRSVGTRSASVFVLALLRARALDEAMSLRAEPGEAVSADAASAAVSAAASGDARRLSPGRILVVLLVLLVVVSVGVLS